MSDPKEGKRTSTPTKNVSADGNQPQLLEPGSSSFGDISTITVSNPNLSTRYDALKMRQNANISHKKNEDMLKLHTLLAICDVKEKSTNTEGIDIDAEIEKLENEIKAKEVLLAKASMVEKLRPLIKKAEEYNRFLDEKQKKLINGSLLSSLKLQKCSAEPDINLEDVKNSLNLIQNNLSLCEGENHEQELTDILQNANKLINQNLSALKDVETWTVHNEATSIILDKIKSERNNKKKESSKNSECN